MCKLIYKNYFVLTFSKVDFQLMHKIILTYEKKLGLFGLYK